jgi:cytochrome c biogenesis protein
MATAAVAVRPQRREDTVEGFWEFFSSLRLVIPLIFALTAACIAGTFVNPSMTPLAEIARSFSERWWWPLYLGLELHDIFHSWWFTLLLVTLGLNIIACTIERLPRIARIILNPDRKLTDKVARGIKQVHRIQAGQDVDAEAGRVAAALRVRGYLPEVAKEGNTVYLFAQRGWYSRFGVWVVHVSLLVMLGGGVLGRMKGFEGTAEVRGDGGSFDFMWVRTATGDTYKKPLPYTAKVNQFTVEFYKTGGPKLFRSDISLLDPSGRQYKRQNVEVNHPLFDSGLAIYQANYREDPEGAQASIAITDKTSGKRYETKLSRGEQYRADNVRFSVESYTGDFAGMGPAAMIRRQEGGANTAFWVFQNRPDFDRLNRNDRFGVEFQGLQKGYFTGLQIAYDPGAIPVFFGCALLLIGLMVCFYTVHRRVWARVEPGTIVLAGSTHKSALAFEKMLDGLREVLHGRGGSRGGVHQDGNAGG